jgi:hypothetical protein
VRRLLLVALSALVLATPALAVDPRYWITAITVAHANLHWSKAEYQSNWSAPVRFERLENGYTRLHFSRRHVQVYFKRGVSGGAAILTWDRRDRTLDNIGPCATVAAFERAYPGTKTITQDGVTIAYKLGRLIFSLKGNRISNVMLAAPSVSQYLGVLAPRCR